MSAVVHEHDEALERGLFERRARARGGDSGVPSLDAVLRASREDSRETSGGRGRAWTGLALAAACLVTVVKTRPHEVSPSGIAAVRMDGASLATEERGGGLCEEQEICTGALEGYASMAPAVPESRACIAPPATFTLEPTRTLSCDRDEANRTEMR